MKLFMKRKKVLYLLVILFLTIFFYYYQNNVLAISKHTIRSERIPTAFHDYKIVQLSDLHSKSFGRDQRNLVKKVERIKPDLIVFTGDLVDANRYDEETSLLLMKELVSLAPVYFVSGNHEWWSGRFESLEENLQNIGVYVLRNTAEVVHLNGEYLTILGIDDPAKQATALSEFQESEVDLNDALKGVTKESDYKILLAHRPELLQLYSKYEVDLVFSGHAHGGQFRVPFFGGMVAPNQGWFPKYTSGKHELGTTTMIVNRGLGNSIIPLRLFNRPEIVVVKLENSERKS